MTERKTPWMLCEKPQVSSSVESLLAYLETLKLDLRRLARAAKLPPDTDLSALSRRQTYELWSVAHRVTEDPDLHLHVAERAPETAHAALTRMFGSASTLGGALRVAALDLQLSHGAALSLETCSTGGYLLLRDTASGEPLPAWEKEYLFAVCALRARGTLGALATPQRVQLTSKGPFTTGEARRIFDCPVELGCAENRLWFSRSQLSRPLAQVRAFSAEPGPQAACEQAAQPTGELAQEVCALIRADLEQGHSLDQAIKQLHLSRRTLQRRLSERGTSFTELTHEVRKRSAQKWLRETSWSLLEISEKLGYGEPSAFSRAFKRWTGLSPARFRRQARLASAAQRPDDGVRAPTAPAGQVLGFVRSPPPAARPGEFAWMACAGEGARWSVLHGA